MTTRGGGRLEEKNGFNRLLETQQACTGGRFFVGFEPSTENRHTFSCTSEPLTFASRGTAQTVPKEILIAIATQLLPCKY